MKKPIIYSFLLVFLSFGIISCEEDEENQNDEELSQDIQNLIPDSTFNTMIDLGMDINYGKNPPDLERAFIATPFVLDSSNIESDYPGMQFSDYKFKFYNQDNENLTIEVDYVNGPESGTGIGGFISGNDKNFTVFAEIKSYAYEDTVDMVHVISGKIVSDGIENLEFANFMLNNYGNSAGYWIENGQGRIIYDEDGFSEEIDNLNTKATMLNKISISAKGKNE
jgi:hypothetical protein